MKTRNVLAVGALVLGVAGTGFAQKSVSETVATKVTATIEAIDSTHRTLTLKGEDGALTTFDVGSDVRRFDELKVGDTVTLRYTESLVLDLRKPGESSNPTGEAAAAGSIPGARPKGFLSKTQTATVTVDAVDPKLPSITVHAEDGTKITSKVKEENRKALAGVKPGDRIDISYTQLVTIEAGAPKAK